MRYKPSGRLTAALIATVAAIAFGCRDTASPIAPPNSQSPSTAVVAEDTLFADGFESGTLTAWDDDVGAAAQAVTADAARSGNFGLRVTLTPSQNGGAITKFVPRGDRLYVRAAVRFAAGFTGAVELLRVRAAPAATPWASFGKNGMCPSGSDWAATIFGTTSPELSLRFLSFFSAMQPDGAGQCWGYTGAPSEGGPSPVFTPPLGVPTGDWHVVEFEAQINTVGAADGWQKFWLDGALKGSWSGLTWRTSSELQWNAVTLDLWSTGVTHTETLDIDDVVALSSRVDTTPPPPAPVATVTVAPDTATLTAGDTLRLVAALADSNGQPLSGRAVSWATSDTAVATVDSTGLVTGRAGGSAAITAASEGQTDVASIVVPPPAIPGEPVFSSSNPDHVLHVEETWATHATMSDLGVARRSDGGPAWSDAGIRAYGQIVNERDPFGSVRYVTSDQSSDPPIPPHGTGLHAAGYHWYGGGSPANGFQGNIYDAQGDDNAVGGSKSNRGFILAPSAYLNLPSRAAVVYEWAVRIRGTNWVEGKDFDINAGNGHGVGRFNVDVQWAPIGWTNGTDALFHTYYGNCSTPLAPDLPSQCDVYTRQINRDNFDLQPIIGAATVHYKQNMNYGTGPGQFSNGRSQLIAGPTNANMEGTNTPMWQAGWLQYKLQITRQAKGQGFGNGRIEMWVKSPTRTVKIMEYVGDLGAKDAGLVYVAPTVASELLAGQIGVYELLSRVYTGGAIVDIGGIRIWSHSR